MAQMLRNCTSARYARNKARMVPLAEYSRDCLKTLRATTGITYDERALGTLQVFRTLHQVEGAQKDMDVLDQFGVPYELLDADECVHAEPGLAGAVGRIAGGLRLPHDETGDCHMFTEKLAELAQAKGVDFRFGVTIERLAVDSGRIAGVDTSAGRLTADAYVAALGPYTPRLVKPLGLDLPVYPVKGYSITLPVLDAAKAPQSTVMDESYKVAITRLGNRIRVGGTAEVAGFDLQLRPARKATLVHSLIDLFAGGGAVEKASFWCGLRPMTPDGPPVIGGTKYENLYLNTGHGTLGWTMACGSARVLADVISGKAPEIAAKELTIARYG
jgi:D-amino-acid dehydrogenase